MRVLSGLRSSVFFADYLLSRLYLRFFQESRSLLIFVFHGLLDGRKPPRNSGIEPQRLIPAEDLGRLIEYFLEGDYTFVTPVQIADGLPLSRRSALITFDDGYFNNGLSLKFLKEYGVPAVFFISTNHVRDQKSYWWDIVYRERTRQGVSAPRIQAEKKTLKRKTHQEIERYLVGCFGERALRPLGDLDRPFTSSELQAFSREGHVFLGNHTSDHAVLPNYPPEGVRAQIAGAQEALLEMTGKSPIMIAYPNGECSEEVIRICAESGLRLGTTVVFGKNRLPLDLDSSSRFLLRRCPVRSDGDLLKSCSVLRSDFTFYGTFERWKAKRNDSIAFSSKQL